MDHFTYYIIDCPQILRYRRDDRAKLIFILTQIYVTWNFQSSYALWFTQIPLLLYDLH